MNFRHRALATAAAFALPAAAVAFAQSGADPWAGEYRGPFDGGRGEVKITRDRETGDYAVNVVTLGEGGCSGEINSVAAPTGATMTLRVFNPGDQSVCKVTLAKTGGTLRVSETGCAAMHGMSCGFSGTATRRSAPAAPIARPFAKPAAAAPRAERVSGTWWNPPSNLTSVGLVDSTGDLDFTMFYASCDRSRQTVWLVRHAMKSKPRDTVLHLAIDGKPFDVRGEVGEDMESGGYDLSADTFYGAPVLDALAHAKTLRVTAGGYSLDLPTTGLRAAFLSFRVHCGFPPTGG
ncbi:hypothetical protein OF829_08970 [Sphingomonas sp. LB-2]|uniref:hypothetical protein n=1 Tax=Sphingomonas caeni TaxID=2984949 RepID=UPI002230EC36|nr:hypothetical protein [Sphingomonas caeni]MCW3847372.1 hypothetical protein [Sphingomonas caeni]